VKFAAPHNALKFRATWLAHRLPGADESLRRALERQVLESEAQERGSLDHMRRVLRTLLFAGEVTESHLAYLFAMHRRTVHRRAAGRGHHVPQARGRGSFRRGASLAQDFGTLDNGNREGSELRGHECFHARLSPLVGHDARAVARVGKATSHSYRPLGGTGAVHDWGISSA
jgi:hypothetical protein